MARWAVCVAFMLLSTIITHNWTSAALLLICPPVTFPKNWSGEIINFVDIFLIFKGCCISTFAIHCLVNLSSINDFADGDHYRKLELTEMQRYRVLSNWYASTMQPAYTRLRDQGKRGGWKTVICRGTETLLWDCVYQKCQRKCNDEVSQPWLPKYDLNKDTLMCRGKPQEASTFNKELQTTKKCWEREDNNHPQGSLLVAQSLTHFLGKNGTQFYLPSSVLCESFTAEKYLGSWGQGMPHSHTLQ